MENTNPPNPESNPPDPQGFSRNLLDEWINPENPFELDSSSMGASKAYSPDVRHFHELKDWEWITNAELLRDEGNIAGRVRAPIQAKVRAIYLHFWSQAEESRRTRTVLETQMAALNADIRAKTDQLQKAEADYQSLGGKDSNIIPYFVIKGLLSVLIFLNAALIIVLSLFSAVGRYFVAYAIAKNDVNAGALEAADAAQLLLLIGLGITLFLLIRTFIRRLKVLPYKPFLDKKEKMLDKAIQALRSAIAKAEEKLRHHRAEYAQLPTDQWYLAHASQRIHHFISEYELASKALNVDEPEPVKQLPTEGSSQPDTDNTEA